MRFLKTIFRFFTIMMICCTFTRVAWGYAIEGEISGLNCNYTTKASCNAVSGCAYYPNDNKCATSFCGNWSSVYCNQKAGCYNSTGKEGDDNCIVCPGGYYCPDSGGNTKKAQQCTAGHYCPVGSGDETECPVGQYQNEAGQSTCKTCGSSTNSRYTTTSGTGSDSINDCKWVIPKGYELKMVNNHSTNVKCAAGYVCPYDVDLFYGKDDLIDTWGRGEACPVGHYCPEGSAVATACSTGTYNKKTGQTNSGACIKCESGKYQNQTGQSSCNACTNKPSTSNATYKSDETGVSVANACSWLVSKCNDGQYFKIETKQCADCAVGAYIDWGNATHVCWRYSTSDSNSYFTCKSDFSQVSSLLPLCKTKNFTYDVYIQYGGTTEKLDYSSSLNGTSDVFMGVQAFTNMLEKIPNRDKIDLDQNKYELYSDVGFTNKLGEMQSDRTFPDTVRNLPNNSKIYMKIILTGKPYKVYMVTSAAPFGSQALAASMVHINTTPIAEKKFGDSLNGVTPDSTKVTGCSVSNGSVTTYGYIASSNQPIYYECSGTSYPVTIYNNTSPKSSMFEPSTVDRNICIAYTQTKCEAGYKCSGCQRTACTAGTYQDELGQTSCKTCSTNTSNRYIKSAAQSTSINDCYLTLVNGQYVPTTSGGPFDCPAGYSCAFNGTNVYYGGNISGRITVKAASPCNSGTYQNEKKQSSCKTCSGAYTPADGQAYTECQECGAGNYITGNNTVCEKCPIGTYQSQSGQSECISCQDGSTGTVSETTGVFKTDNTNGGATARTQCYLNPNLKLIDLFNDDGTTVLSNTDRVYYIGKN